MPRAVGALELQTVVALRHVGRPLGVACGRAAARRRRRGRDRPRARRRSPRRPADRCPPAAPSTPILLDVAAHLLALLVEIVGDLREEDRASLARRRMTGRRVADERSWRARAPGADAAFCSSRIFFSCLRICSARSKKRLQIGFRAGRHRDRDLALRMLLPERHALQVAERRRIFVVRCRAANARWRRRGLLPPIALLERGELAHRPGIVSHVGRRCDRDENRRRGGILHQRGFEVQPCLQAPMAGEIDLEAPPPRARRAACAAPSSGRRRTRRPKAGYCRWPTSSRCAKLTNTSHLQFGT